VLSPVTAAEVRCALESTKAGWSIGAAGIPSELIRVAASSLAYPLTCVFNMSLSTGVFPNRLKDASIIPLFKNKGDPRLPSNYRPISLVDYLSKVFEKLMLSRVEAHLRAAKFFSSCQFGFRKFRSTELALGHLWQEIADSLEDNMLCLGVF